MPAQPATGPRIGVSACLHGCPVRYDGRALEATGVLAREVAGVTFTPVCPECMAGLGVPRPPVRLTAPGEEVLAGRGRVVEEGGRGVTEAVLAGARACAEALDRAGAEAVVLKEGSPSCGLELAGIGSGGRRGAGVFGALMMASGRFLLSERALEDPLLWWDARGRLFAWSWLRRRDIRGSAELRDAWRTVECVLSRLDRRAADAIDRELAALPARPPVARLDGLRARALDALRTPPTRSRARRAMREAYARHARAGLLDAADPLAEPVRPPTDRETVARMAEDLLRLERISLEGDLLFGTSPAMRRAAARVRAREADRRDPT